MVNICTIITVQTSGKWWIRHHIAEQKKLAAAKAAKLAASALLTQAAATPAPVAGMTAVLPLPAAAPSQDKLNAANLAKLVMDHLSLAVKAELENP
jgi:hypothetical protein